MEEGGGVRAIVVMTVDWRASTFEVRLMRYLRTPESSGGEVGTCGRRPWEERESVLTFSSRIAARLVRRATWLFRS